MRVSLVPALWPGDTLSDVRRVVSWGAESGVSGVWLSETNGYDAIGLGVAVAPLCGTAELLIGPVSPLVRDPALLAMGIATVAAATDNQVVAVLGRSSPTIVGSWHGRHTATTTGGMRVALEALRAALHGDRTDHDGPGVGTRGFRLQVPGPDRLEIALAAQGRQGLRLAGEMADRVVANLVTPSQLSEMVDVVRVAAAAAGRPPPPMAVWLATGSEVASRPRVASLLTSYVNAPGYRERFVEGGLLDDSGLIEGAVDRLAVFGQVDAIVDRIGEYRAAGAAEVALVASGQDPHARTIIRETVAAAS